MTVPDEAAWALDGDWLAGAIRNVEPLTVVAAVGNDVAGTLANTSVFCGRGRL